MFVPLNCLDKKYKLMILSWLANKVSKNFMKKYKHDFRDQWIIWSIYDDTIFIMLDFRVDAQKQLFDKLPDKNKGCLQKGTGKLVNKKTLYFPLEPEIETPFPKIIKHELFQTIKHKDNDGDKFYEYYWEVFLEDGTSIEYRNQDSKMDLTEKSLKYMWMLQERAFRQFLDGNYRVAPNYTEKEVMELLSKAILEYVKLEDLISWFRENRK